MKPKENVKHDVSSENCRMTIDCSASQINKDIVTGNKNRSTSGKKPNGDIKNPCGITSTGQSQEPIQTKDFHKFGINKEREDSADVEKNKLTNLLEKSSGQIARRRPLSSKSQNRPTKNTDRCCGHWFPNKKSYIRHLEENASKDQSHHLQLLEDGWIPCTECSSWIQADSMNGHLRRVHGFSKSRPTSNTSPNSHNLLSPSKKLNLVVEVDNKTTEIANLASSIPNSETLSVTKLINSTSPNKKNNLNKINKPIYSSTVIVNSSNLAEIKKVLGIMSPRIIVKPLVFTKNTRLSSSKLSSKPKPKSKKASFHIRNNIKNFAKKSKGSPKKEKYLHKKLAGVNTNSVNKKNKYNKNLKVKQKNGIENNFNNLKKKRKFMNKKGRKNASYEDDTEDYNCSLAGITKKKRSLKGSLVKKYGLTGRPQRNRSLLMDDLRESSSSEYQSFSESEHDIASENEENEPITNNYEKYKVVDDDSDNDAPTVELDLFILPSFNEDASVFLTDPKNPNFKVYASMDAIFVGDSALGDVTNQLGYVTDSNNVVFVNPSHFLFPNIKQT